MFLHPALGHNVPHFQKGGEIAQDPFAILFRVKVQDVHLPQSSSVIAEKI